MKTKQRRVVVGTRSRAEVCSCGDGIVLQLGSLSLQLDLLTADDLAETLERALLLATLTQSDRAPAPATLPPSTLS
jgi:hypothetical protein